LKTANRYSHQRALPRWYWTGETDMACMRAAIGQTLQYGYAHQIQRLMLIGNFALLAEISPQQVADWTLALYVDAVEWAALPKTAGIALLANGGRYAGKPYLASGADIERQSNYCQGCRYDPARRIGPDACPLTTLYWHFLDQHEATLAQNPRTALMAKNISRLSAEERGCIQSQAARVLAGIDTL
jgi:deoxyribodipyrimidine photolyase-related protein